MIDIYYPILLTLAVDTADGNRVRRRVIARSQEGLTAIADGSTTRIVSSGSLDELDWTYTKKRQKVDVATVWTSLVSLANAHP